MSLGIYALCAASLAGACLYFFLAYVPGRRAAAITAWEQELVVRADLHKMTLDHWVAVGMADAEILASYPTPRAAIPYDVENLTAIRAADAAAHLREVAVRFARMRDYHRFVLLDANLRVVVGVGAAAELDRPDLQAAAQVLAQGKTMVDFHRYADGRVAVVFLARVGADTASRTGGGVVLLEADPNKWLYPYLGLRPMAAASAETVLARADGDDVLFLNHLRYAPAPPLTLRRPANAIRFAATAAIEGRGGFDAFVDYRGEPVFAATVRLDRAPWGVVVKVDEREALAGYRQEIRHTGTTAVGVFVGFWAVAFILVLVPRRREKQSLESQHALLQAMANSSVDIIVFSLDTRYCYTAFNEKHRREMKRVWNVDIEVGMNQLDCMRMPEARSLAKSSTDRALRGESFTEEQQQPGLDICYEFSWNPILRGTEIVGAAAFTRDVTLRKRQEADLRASEARLRAVLDAAPFPVALADVEYNKIEFWSRSALALFGHTAPTAPEWHAIAYPDPEYRSEVVERWKAVLAEARASSQTVNAGEYRVTCRDGSVRLCELHATFLSDRLVVTFNDISARKRAEADLAASNVDLERRVAERTAELSAANQELESFAYAVSHDLRAPLRGIDGWSQAVLEDCGPQLDERGRGYLATVRQECQRMGRLIDELLALSRVTRAPLERKTMDLTALAQELGERLRAGQPEREVEFVVAPGMVAMGDAVLLHAVMQNLLDNAWKFTGGRPRARIEVGSTLEGGRTVYYVRDDGAGFDMRFAGKLFAPFHRLHSLEDFPGAGIGLATVRRIIQRHGGKVWATAEVDRGATFCFSLTE